MTGVWKAVVVVDICRLVVQAAIATMKAAATTPNRTFFVESECRRRLSLVVILLIEGHQRGG